MQVWPPRRAVADVRFVIATAGADGSCPAGVAIRLVVDVMVLEEVLLRFAIDAVPDGAELVSVAAGEAVADPHIAVSRDAEQPESGAAGVSLAHALVDFLQ